VERADELTRAAAPSLRIPDALPPCNFAVLPAISARFAATPLPLGIETVVPECRADLTKKEPPASSPRVRC